MKKLKTLLCVLLTLLSTCCLFLFSGCNVPLNELPINLSGCNAIPNLIPEKKIAGVYKFYSYTETADGMSVELKVGEKFMGVLTLTEDFITVTLNEDGTASMRTTEEGQQIVETGTWKESASDTVILHFYGEDESVFCDGNKMILTSTEEGITTTMVLQK